MQLGYIGLGKMGYNMAELLLDKGHEIVAYNRNSEPVKKIAQRGARPADSPGSLAGLLKTPRLVWIMVPHTAVDSVLQDLTPYLSAGDAVIDGGNSPYEHSMRRAAELERQGIDFLDAGVSGGPHGARTGACIMIGGRRQVFQRFEQLFRDLSADKAYAYLGPSGAGHFVKMVHNGIEYGMMQALAEGFTILRQSGFGLDLAEVAGLYNRRSVIESRLVGWLREAYERSGPDLDGVSGTAAHSGEGLWTVETARKAGIAAPVIEASLAFRVASEKTPSYTGRIISALRHQFGGHAVGEDEKHKK